MPQPSRLNWTYERTENGKNTTHVHTVKHTQAGKRLNLPTKFELTKTPNEEYVLRVTMGNHLQFKTFEFEKKDGKITVNYAMNYAPASSHSGESTSPVETQIKPMHYAPEFKDVLDHARVSEHPNPREHSNLLKILREIDTHLTLSAMRDLPKVDAAHARAVQTYFDPSKIKEIHNELFAALPRNKLVSNFSLAIKGTYAPSRVELPKFVALAHLLEIHPDVNFEPAGATKASVKSRLKIAINNLPDASKWKGAFPKIFENLEFKGRSPTKKSGP